MDLEEVQKMMDNSAMLRFAAIAMTDWLALPSYPTTAPSLAPPPPRHSQALPYSRKSSTAGGTFTSGTRSPPVSQLQPVQGFRSPSALISPACEPCTRVTAEYVPAGGYRLQGFGNCRPHPLFQTVRKHRVSPATRRLRRALYRLASRQEGTMRVGIHLLHLRSGEETSLRSTQTFPLASVAKLPIMVEAALQLQAAEKSNGALRLSSTVSIREGDKCIGSGQLWKRRSGTKVSFGKCLELMQTVSDNTAADLVLRRVSIAKVRQRLVNLGLLATDICLSQRQAYLIAMGNAPKMAGMSSRQIANTWKALTTYQRMGLASETEAANKDLSFVEFNGMEASAEKLSELEKSSRRWRDNLAVAAAVDNTGTPADISRLLTKLARGEILSQPWTGHCFSILAKQKCGKRRLPCYLPEGTSIYHKTGSIAGVVHDAGIFQVEGGQDHVVVSAFVDGIHRYHEREAEAVIARIGRMVYKAYSTVRKFS